jgi:hypothetical protein
MIGGSLTVLLALALVDPSLGFIQNTKFAGVISIIMTLATSILYITLLHIARKALFDYLDFGKIAIEALKSPEGSGMTLIAVAIAMLSISLVILASVT